MLDTGRRHFEGANIKWRPVFDAVLAIGARAPREAGIDDVGCIIFCGQQSGISGCRGAEALHVAIDQPMPGVRVVRVAGELDMLTAPQLASCLLRQIDARGGHVVVDLSKVTFLGAAGLGSLVKAREVATCHHVELHLTGVDHRAVACPLEITGLRPTFTIQPSAESVIARVGGPAQLTDCAAAEAS